MRASCSGIYIARKNALIGNHQSCLCVCRTIFSLKHIHGMTHEYCLKSRTRRLCRKSISFRSILPVYRNDGLFLPLCAAATTPKKEHDTSQYGGGGQTQKKVTREHQGDCGQLILHCTACFRNHHSKGRNLVVCQEYALSKGKLRARSF